METVADTAKHRNVKEMIVCPGNIGYFFARQQKINTKIPSFKTKNQ